MQFDGYVQDYQLRDLLRIGQPATILGGSVVNCSVPSQPEQEYPSRHLERDLQVTVTNFLPGFVDIYADSMGKRKTHNHQVVWKDGGTYYSTDINNVKEIQDAKGN
jgi:hypothetical protein